MDAEIDDAFTLPFPIEFLIRETPRSHQSKNAAAKEEWKQVVRRAARDCIAAQRAFTWLDERVIECVTMQEIEPGIVVRFASMTETLEAASAFEPPVVCIRIDDDLTWRDVA